jgi:N-acetyl-gamma-glutamylphosphate reductase
MRATLGILVGLAVLFAAVATPASAHHAFAAEFDATQCVDVEGVLTRVAYENPHAYIFLDVKNEAGQMEEATFQLSSTSNLRRGGATLPVFNANIGKTVMVRGCAARNGEKGRYAGSFVRLADGTIQRVGQDVEGVFGTKVWR